MDICLPDLTESLQCACTVRVVYHGVALAEVTLEGLEISVPYGRGSIHQTLDKTQQQYRILSTAMAAHAQCCVLLQQFPFSFITSYFVTFLIRTSKDLLMLISMLGC
jgi:hypothetical protein